MNGLELDSKLASQLDSCDTLGVVVVHAHLSRCDVGNRLPSGDLRKSLGVDELNFQVDGVPGS